MEHHTAIAEPSFEAVLRLAMKGWRIHPCKPRDKAPMLRSWPERATCDRSTIEEWALTFRDCNWAVKTGADSGIWVLDCDGAEGMASLDAWVHLHGDRWLKGLTAITSNGQHSYFENPADVKIRNSASKLSPGLDVRGDGGYVIVPPSLHPSGRHYRWADPDATVLPTPEWLLRLLESRDTTSKQPNTIGKFYYPGRRNDGLTRLAGAARRKGMVPDELLAFVLDANSHRCVPPLDETEVAAIAESVSRYPVGGPDPLEVAWQVVSAGVYESTYERFIALFIQLQLQRPGLPIALPLERIAALFGCDWSLIRRYRRRAVDEGRLELVERSIPHKRAATYFVRVPLGSTTKSTSSGLVVPHDYLEDEL